MNSKKAIVLLVVLVLVLWGGYALMKKDPVDSTEPIKIGVSLPLTGDLAFVGETDRNAILLAMEEIQAQKNLKRQYELVFEDDSFSSVKAVTAMNKFISVDKVNAVISVGSTAGNVIAPMAESAGIIHIGLASDPVIAKGDYNFINWTRPQEEVSVLIKEMQSRGVTKVGLLAFNQQGTLAISQDFKERAGTVGISVSEEIFNPGQKDFRTTISKLQKENPQIYLLLAFDPEIAIIGKQIRDLGIKTPLTSVESFGLTSEPGVFEGQWYVDGALPTSNFVTKYQNKYGKEPGPAAANAYDSIHLLVKAFESFGQEKVDGIKVAKALNSMNEYSGALGPMTVSAEGIFISQASVKMIKDGKSINISE